MKQVAYLCCAETHSKSSDRRPDAYEHDISLHHIRTALDDLDRHVVEVDWTEPRVDWGAYEAVVIGTTWNYTDHRGKFLRKLASIACQAKLLNPLSIVRWNLSKRYLHFLAKCGIPTIPTLWADGVDVSCLHAAMEHFRTDTLVLKPEIGASGVGQYLVERLDSESDLSFAASEKMLIQPFVEAILDIGELSLVFAGRRFSHALRKRPRGGDYRVQSLYGGTEEEFLPDRAQIEVAERALSLVEGSVLYARVDLVLLSDGRWAVIELEMIEPYLYPSFGPLFSTLLRERYLQLADEPMLSRAAIAHISHRRQSETPKHGAALVEEAASSL